MKYLLILVFVLVVFWLWRHNRNTEKNAVENARNSHPRPASKETEVTQMVACDVCHVHLPRSEALIGNKGIYCSDAHRRQGES